MDKIKEILGKITKKKEEGESTEERREDEKRVKISKVQQQMMLAVAGASVVFGISIVLSIHFIQYMSFYGKVLAAEDVSIDGFYASLINSGACLDLNGDKKITGEELAGCVPDKTPLAKTSGTLRYNVLVNMAQNKDLESVGREQMADCRDKSNSKKMVDYAKLYEEATTSSDREKYLGMIKMCSALRVIPDALPAQKNEEALMASLNKVFLLANWEPESLSPGDASSTSGDGSFSTELGGMGVSVSVDGRPAVTMRVLQSMERSIRTFNPTRASISWSASGITLQSQADAFYTENKSLVKTTKTITAKTRGK